MADGGGPVRVDFSSTAVGHRLLLCAELAGMGRQSAGKGTKAAELRRQRAHAILRTLLPGELGPGRTTDVLYSKRAASLLFTQAIEAAREASPAAKVRAGLLVKDLQKMAGHAVAAGWVPGKDTEWPKVPDEFLQAAPGIPGEDAFAHSVLSEAKLLGALPEGLQGAVKAAIEANPERYLTMEQLAEEFPKEHTEYERTHVERAALYDEYRHLFHQAPDAPETLEAREKWRAMAERNDAANDMLKALNEGVLATRRTAIKSAVADYVADFVNASDVTPEQAQEWTSSHLVITKTAAARLKKLGYPPADVIKDAAEFYRLARGRIEKVVIDSRGDRRANAVGSQDHGTAGRVNLGSGFDKRVLWHELGHHVEADPVAAAAARLFIRLRSKDGGKVHRLSKLTGHKGYGASEVAYANGFFHPYVGKVYPQGLTEVFSMGLESFSDPRLLAHRIAADPETFEFVTGYMRSPKTSLQRLHLAMRQSLREAGETADATAEQTAKDAIARELAKVNDFIAADRLPAETADWWAAHMVASHSDKIVGYMGSVAEGLFYVMAVGRWINPKTRRIGKTLRLYKVERDAQSLPVARDGFPLNEPEIARLALASWRQTGIQPRYEYIASGSLTLEG